MKRAHVEQEPGGGWTVSSRAPLRTYGTGLTEADARARAARLEARWKPTSIECSGCGRPLPAGLVAAIATDTDFFQHGDHTAGWAATPANFAEARRVSAELGRVIA